MNDKVLEGYQDLTESDAKWIQDNVVAPVEESGEFEGELFLSSDGKNTVHIKASTKEGRKAGLTWAKSLYDKLMHTYGSKQSISVKEYAKEGQPDLGKCVKCGAENKMSSKGKAYCSALCWI